MLQIDNRKQYQQIVSDLADEFAADIDNGAASSVATHMVVAFNVVDGEPTVLDAIEYEGEPVESIDSCLSPYDVLQYSHTENLPHASGYRAGAGELACECLTLDLLRERGLR